MEAAEVEKSASSEDSSQLNRNRSFKSKQLVRSQAIRESQSPPRALSPAQHNATNNVASDTACNVTCNVATDSEVRTVSVAADSDNSSHFSGRGSVVFSGSDVKYSDSDVKHSDSDVKNCDSDGCTKKQPVEIQITSGSWESEAHSEQGGGQRRWLAHAHSESSRDLLSNSPRVACVCGACANCPHCRGRRRRRLCPTKQDSGIVCPDDCPDWSDTEQSGNGSNNDLMRKSGSLDIDDQTFYCRCPDRKERPKNISLSKNESDDRTEPTGPELVNFIKDTLNKNARDRTALLKIEKELHSLVNDTGRCIVRFPVMTSYGRMLVHRCASLFQLSHHLDQNNKTSVMVSKSGTSGGRIPCTSFKEWCVASFPPSPQRHPPDSHAKSILKRDTHSLDEPGAGVLASNRSKSLEQRERDYERVRRRIFSSDNCSHQDESQWPWLNSGPIKVLTPETGRNKLLKVQSFESSGSASGCGGAGSVPGSWRARGAVSKSHSFGGYAHAEPAQQHQPHRLLSRQGDLASSSWRLSPSSSGYKTLSLRSTDSVTPSPTGVGSPEPAGPGARVVWCATELAAVPAGALVIHPQTGRPLTNPDGSVYHFDPANPPVLYDPAENHNDQQKIDQNNEKRRGRLEKQHSFIDNDCECQPSEECHQRNTSEKETNTKPPSPPAHYETNAPPNHAQVPTNQKPQFEPTTNHNPPTETNQRQHETPPNQGQVYENQITNKHFDNQRCFEVTTQGHGNDAMANRVGKVTNHESQEMPYPQVYVQGYRAEDLTSPSQLSHYVQADAQPAKMTTVHMPDQNIRQMALANMVYPTAVPQGYPYQCRVDQPLQPVYQTLVQPHEEQKQLAPSPHAAENTFRIDPSYPYAAVDYTSACGACVDTASLQHQQRSYSVPYGHGQMEVPPVLPAYPLGNVLLPQPHMQPYPYQDGAAWGQPGAGAAKLVLPELFPLPHYPRVYPHYNIVYPQVIPQPYPICQPMYPVIEKQPEQPQRRNSFTGNHTKRNSVSGSARNTPSQEEKVPYDEEEIAAEIQRVMNQMEQLDVQHRERRRRDDPRPRAGAGLLGARPALPAQPPHPAHRRPPPGRPTNDESQLSSAARAIVNSIRNMQAKNTYQDSRRPERHEAYRERPERDPPPRAAPPAYRPPYMFRQMSPGTWSPRPMHPVLNHPRRPHPDARNGRR